MWYALSYPYFSFQYIKCINLVDFILTQEMKRKTLFMVLNTNQSNSKKVCFLRMARWTGWSASSSLQTVQKYTQPYTHQSSHHLWWFCGSWTTSTMSCHSTSSSDLYSHFYHHQQHWCSGLREWPRWTLLPLT